MLDYQFLGIVAVVLALVSRGSFLPVVAVTAIVGLLTLACEGLATWFRRRRRPESLRRPAVRPGRKSATAIPNPSDGDFHRWMAAVERVLRSAE